MDTSLQSSGILLVGSVSSGATTVSCSGFRQRKGFCCSSGAAPFTVLVKGAGFRGTDLSCRFSFQLQARTCKDQRTNHKLKLVLPAARKGESRIRKPAPLNTARVRHPKVQI